MKKIKTLQNKILKILFKQNFLKPTVDLYRDLELRQIQEILKIEQSKLVYKILNNQIKTNITIKISDQVHSYNTRNNTNIFTEFSRTNIALFNPIKRAADTFNSIPSSIRTVKSYPKFVSIIKKQFSEI